MLPLSSDLLAALTFLSWPSGPHLWLRLLTTSPTELQIGRHTMPQILIHQHNALTNHTPSLLFNSHHIPSVHVLVFLSLSFILFVHVISSSSLQVYLSLLGLRLSGSLVAFGGVWWADNRNHLPPYSGTGQHEQDEPELPKPLPSKTKVVCSIIQTGATPTAASATLTLTNGQKNRWFVHSWPV